MRYPVTVRGARLFGEIEGDYSEEWCLSIMLYYPDGRDAEWTAQLREEEYQDIERQVRSQMTK